MFVISDFDSFICGFAYGTTTVIVGQPLDTIKTRMQAKGTGNTMITTAVSIFQREGVAGLYRGLKTSLQIFRRKLLVSVCHYHKHCFITLTKFIKFAPSRT